MDGPRTPPLLRVPLDARKIIYDHLIQAEREARLDDQNGHNFLTSTTPTAAAIRLSGKLINRQLYREFQASYYAGSDWAIRFVNTVSGPVSGIEDNDRVRFLLANARSLELQGFTGGFRSSEPDYSVRLSLRRVAEPGYRPEWQHLNDATKVWLGISEGVYQAMVKRVESTISMAIARLTEQKESSMGLEWEEMDQIVDAFFLCDMLGPGDQADQIKITDGPVDDEALPWEGAEGDTKVVSDW